MTRVRHPPERLNRNFNWIPFLVCRIMRWYWKETNKKAFNRSTKSHKEHAKLNQKGFNERKAQRVRILACNISLWNWLIVTAINSAHKAAHNLHRLNLRQTQALWPSIMEIKRAPSTYSYQYLIIPSSAHTPPSPHKQKASEYGSICLCIDGTPWTAFDMQFPPFSLLNMLLMIFSLAHIHRRDFTTCNMFFKKKFRTSDISMKVSKAFKKLFLWKTYRDSISLKFLSFLECESQ